MRQSDDNLINLDNLSQDELKHLAAGCLLRIEHPEKGIGTELFEAIIKVTPQPCVECIVVDNVINPSKIFLIWRDDEHYHGWHFPGAFMRYGNNFEETIEAIIVARELSGKVGSIRRTGINYSIVDSRGHAVAAGVYLVQLSEEPEESETRKWFPIGSIPNDLLKHHMEMLEELGQA